MARYYESGYSRGGIDVSEAVNLFFKGLLLFPVFVLTIFIGLTMVKNILYNGLPLMNGPSEEQRERIRENDRDYQGYELNAVTDGTSVMGELPPAQDYQNSIPNSTGVLPYTYNAHGVPSEHYNTDTLQEPVEEAWITSIEESPFE